MRRSDFAFDLPPALIAQAPATPRSASRMLCVDVGEGDGVGDGPGPGHGQDDGAGAGDGRCVLRDRHTRDLPDELQPGDLLVLNDTRVLAARLLGVKEGSGGRVELLIERVLDERSGRVLAQLRASKPARPGSTLLLDGALRARVLGRAGDFYEVEFDAPDLHAALERHGHVPLPPYIARSDAAADRERYQTVYARAPGAVAAPTAGLHFDDALLTALEARGVQRATLTLHVGAGTFAPVRSDDLSAHRMHRERYVVDAALCAAIDAARARGGRVVAVGTTVVRALESAAREQAGAAPPSQSPDPAEQQLRPIAGETDIFITPGYAFRVVDALLTNFHLPESTLLMLVCAFAGHAPVMAAYRHAVESGYRFYSYGDAMWLPRRAGLRPTQA